MKLTIDNVSFSYDGKETLKDLSFEVKASEILGIVGPNGSGKSTLLKCINKVLRPKSGIVFLDKLNLSLLKQKEIARKIGVVPQNSINKFPFTVFDTVIRVTTEATASTKPTIKNVVLDFFLLRLCIAILTKFIC